MTGDGSLRRMASPPIKVPRCPVVYMAIIGVAVRKSILVGLRVTPVADYYRLRAFRPSSR